MTIYHTINWFFAFSFIGYLLECTVLSYENRRPVLDMARFVSYMALERWGPA